MNPASAQFDLADLLLLAGATPPRYGHGKWECPSCHRRALSVNTERGLYHCFHAGCDFAGNTEMLARQLGLARRLPAVEYVDLCRRREAAREAALRLYAFAHQRQLDVREGLRALGRIELVAHSAGADDETAWETLEQIYSGRSWMEAELDLLESGDARTVYEAMMEW